MDTMDSISISTPFPPSPLREYPTKVHTPQISLTPFPPITKHNSQTLPNNSTPSISIPHFIQTPQNQSAPHKHFLTPKTKKGVFIHTIPHFQITSPSSWRVQGLPTSRGCLLGLEFHHYDALLNLMLLILLLLLLLMTIPTQSQSTNNNNNTKQR